MFRRRRKEAKRRQEEQEKEANATKDCKAVDEEKKEDSDDNSLKEEEEEEEENDNSQNISNDEEGDTPAATPAERLEQKRQDALQYQKTQETKALARNSFCKHQRVLYTHKASGRKYEAVIVAVHLDDGLDRPYYTIRYNAATPVGQEDTNVPAEPMEKQTTPDRLAYLAFDEAKAYHIIAARINNLYA